MQRTMALVLLGMCVGVLATAARAADEKKAHEGAVISVADGKLVIEGKDGEEQAFQVGDDAKIMIDGKPGKLTDLKKDKRVTVMTGDGDKVLSVTCGAKKPAPKK